jgi:hypothetical protein
MVLSKLPERDSVVLVTLVVFFCGLPDLFHSSMSPWGVLSKPPECDCVALGYLFNVG